MSVDTHSHLGKQNFLVSVQGPPGVNLFSPKVQGAAATDAERRTSEETAATAQTPLQPQQQQQVPGNAAAARGRHLAAMEEAGQSPRHQQRRATGGLSMALHQDAAKSAAAVAQQALARVALAWHELLVMFSSMRLGEAIYQLMPDLVSAIAVGDQDAVFVFKKVRLV